MNNEKNSRNRKEQAQISHGFRNFAFDSQISGNVSAWLRKINDMRKKSHDITVHSFLAAAVISL